MILNQGFVFFKLSRPIINNYTGDDDFIEYCIDKEFHMILAYFQPKNKTIYISDFLWYDLKNKTFDYYRTQDVIKNLLKKYFNLDTIPYKK